MQDVYLGIDIGGTNTKYGFIKKNGVVISSHKIKTNTQIPFVDYAKGLKEDVMQKFSEYETEFSIKAIGVGAPNGNGRTGFIENPPNLAWDVVDLRGVFSKVFSLPVTVENDANVAAVGEKKFGVAKNLSDFIVITLGTGLGVGTFIGGELYLGHHGLGSEAGHITIVPDGRSCGCGGQGHLEAYASCTGMKKTVNEKLGADLTFREVSSRFQAGDKEIKAILEQSAKELAIGLASMNALLAPEAFILCGGGTSLGEEFLLMVNKYYQEYVYPSFRNYSKILMSEVSNEFGAILGAASLAI